MLTPYPSAERRASLPIWGMVGVAVIVCILVLSAFVVPALRATEILDEITGLRSAAADFDERLGRYAQALNAELLVASSPETRSSSPAGPRPPAPDTRPMASAILGRQHAAAVVRANAGADLLSALEVAATESRSIAEIAARETEVRKRENARFRSAMLRLRAEVARSNGLARLAAVRKSGASDASARTSTLQPLMVEALELGLLVKELEDSTDPDTATDIIENRIQPSLERLADLVSPRDREAESLGATAEAVNAVVESLRGDSKSGSVGILAAFRESRRLDARQRTLGAETSQRLDGVRDMQASIRALAEARLADLRSELSDSLQTALWRAVSASVVGIVLTAGLASLLAGTAKRRASALARAMSAERDSRTRAEAALREFEALRRTVDEQSIVSVTDADGRIIEVNDNFCRTSGYSREELIGRDHRIINSGAHPKEFWTQMWQTVSSGKAWRGEVCNRAKNGWLYWADTVNAPFFGADGRIEKYVSIRTDITARKTAERAMAASEHRLRTIIDAEPECVKVVGPGNLVLDMNPAGLAMLEADSVEQVRDLTLAHFVLPEYQPTLADLNARVLRGESDRLTFEIMGLRGTRRWLDTHAVPLCNAAGQVEAVLAVTRDITAQREAEEQIRNGERFLRSAIDSLESHTVVLDATGRIISVNKAWREFALANGGTARDVLEGSNYLDACDSAASCCPEAGRIAAAVRAALSAEQSPGAPGADQEPVEYACHSPTEKRWFLSSVRGFARGSERFAVVSHLNITAIRSAEESLRHLMQVQGEMGAMARIGGWELDPATNLGTWTDQMYAIFEVPPTYTPELASSLAHFPGDAKDTVERCVQRAIETGEPFEYTVPFITAGGRRLWVRGMGRAERRGGKTARLYGAFQDVTDSQLASEELIKARDAARAANRAKSAFLANMSHEIRTPLTAILGFADLLHDDGDISAAPKGRIEAIHTIQHAGKHLLAVINDILDLSKIEAERMVLERIEVALPTVLRTVESLLRPQAAGKGVALNVTFATPVPERMLGDPTRVRQILMNLVGNAVKFTEVGSVTISAGTEYISGRPMLVLDVSDTGAGMTAEQTSRLFSAFEQADSTVTRKYGGTGLGLAVSRRLANLMGGDVVLMRTQPGIGSCFRLALPLEAAAGAGLVNSLDSVKAAPLRPSTADAAALPGRILLAEDGPDNQRLIAFHLRKAGAEVEIADNGVIALQKLEMAESAGRPYNLLLTDMQMPEMDGYTLARTLRERGSDMPIVALTAHAMAEDKDKCLDAGCNDYTTKPIDKASLLATCAKWIDRNSRATAQ